MRRLRRAKIVATLGPASTDPAMMAKLFAAGADVFRINMSHTSQDRMRELIAMIRAIEHETGRPIGVLVDLQGPKLRLGTFIGGQAMVAKGDTFVLDSNSAPGDATRVYLPHPEIFMAVEPGHTLLIDDGKVRLTVTEAESNRLVTRVEVGGRLADRKGLNWQPSTKKSKKRGCVSSRQCSTRLTTPSSSRRLDWESKAMTAPSMAAFPTCTIFESGSRGIRPMRRDASTLRCRPNPPAR